ncbi:MAG: catalase/peroxidase HPI [Gammaproteobacteria bacterium]
MTSLAPLNVALAQQDMVGNEYWWPNRLDLDALRQEAVGANPLGDDFDYAEAFESLELDEVVADLEQLMTTSQNWWPADFGHYGPFFIRMAWHSAGTYRTIDGRGGADGGYQRFAPLNSWPDNANLDKARLLLWPIKQKYGRALSWADLMILAGTVAMDSMGFETAGFAGGRVDDWKPEAVNWGPEGEWLAADRRDESGRLEGPFGATQMGLIYVNPEGPGGNPDPQAAADAIREAFGRMAMNDEETAALIAGGHTFGKAHGAASPSDYVGPEPEAESLEAQGKGWLSSYGSGKGADTITSGLEGAWTFNPAAWTHNYLENLYAYEWVQTRSPAGAVQWEPAGGAAASLVPDAHDPSQRHAPMMFTTDLALKVDPAYREITSRWLENPAEFEDAFARAWFKLTHRDLGPSSRYLGDLVPEDTYVWQDPIPEVDYDLVNERDVRRLKSDILDSGLTVPELVRAAWASASTYRQTDMRGGANGGRVRLAPQRNWEANDPQELARVIEVLEGIQEDFNGGRGSKKVSLADLIVLGGAAAIEKAAEDAGFEVEVPFIPGRGDATQEMTDVESFSVLEPQADGFRNYFENGNSRSPAEMLIEKAALLDLTIPEMTVLVGGMRALDANTGGARHGVFTDQPGTLSNDFFVNLLDLSTEWSQTAMPGLYEGSDMTTGQIKWTATPVDLIFGSNSELRAVAEFYATDDAQEQFVQDFVAAWTKVMTLDRFDLEG